MPDEHPHDAPGLEVLMRRTMAVVKQHASLPPDVGVAVFVFHYGSREEPGYLAYGSTGNRDDCLRMIGKWLLEQLERRGPGPWQERA